MSKTENAQSAKRVLSIEEKKLISIKMRIIISAIIDIDTLTEDSNIGDCFEPKGVTSPNIWAYMCNFIKKEQVILDEIKREEDEIKKKQY